MKKTPILILLFTISFQMGFPQSEYSSPIIGIGVVVSDLERSVDFYQNTIGMKRVRQFDINSDFGLRSGLSGGVPFSVEVMKLEDTPNATEWKLLSFGKEAQHPKQKWIHMETHLGIRPPGGFLGLLI